MEKTLFKVDEKSEGTRIDKYLSDIFQEKSRSFIQELIKEEKVKVNNKIPKNNYKVKAFDNIELELQEEEILKVEAEDIHLNILYEDNNILVVNKEQGMVVHPAPGNYNGTLVNALLFHCKDLSSINGEVRPGIVHRIDKYTSGILVVAKNDEVHNKLSEQLKDHSMKREYYALIEGRLKNDKGTINKPIGRNKKDRLKMGIVKEGKHAVTHYEVLERYNGYTFIKCRLETGRTHQIRVHMSSIGFPVVGDPLYGFKKQKFKLEGQMLHAKTLGFIHPNTNEYIEFNSELPNYFTNIINKLRNE